MKSKILKRITPYFFILSFMAFSGCLVPNNFPDPPEISMNDLIFVDAPDVTPDTLAIIINFQDGDGDLGLDSKTDIVHPFNDKFYFTYAEAIQQTVKFTVYYKNNLEIYYSAFFETQGEMDAFTGAYLSGISFTKQSFPGIPYSIEVAEGRLGSNNIFLQNLIEFKSRSILELDTLPGFVHPYNCLNWQITENQDTLYYQSNLYHSNILVDFFVDQGNGVFQEFDWETDLFKYPQCNTSFDGRFPVLNDSDRDKPLEGTIRYNMTSLGFLNLFSVKRLKLRIQIIDRALNKSNVIETVPFRLEDIKK